MISIIFLSPKPYITCITRRLFSPLILALIKALNSLLLFDPKSKQALLPSTIALFTALIIVESEAYFDTNTHPTLVTFAVDVVILREAVRPKGALGKS